MTQCNQMYINIPKSEKDVTRVLTGFKTDKTFFYKDCYETIAKTLISKINCTKKQNYLEQAITTHFVGGAV